MMPKRKATMFNPAKIILAGFVLALLLSAYLLLNLATDLQFKGGLPYPDLALPILYKLYVVLGITAALAIALIYWEMKNTKQIIVFKEKTAAQKKEEQSQNESHSKRSLESKSVTGVSNADIISNALKTLANTFQIVAGACYISKADNDTKRVELINGFGLPLSETDVIEFKYGEGLIGQVAKSGLPIYVDEIPEGYFQVTSGLGSALPRFVMVLPLKKNDEVIGVLEAALFKPLNDSDRNQVEKFSNEIGARLK